MNPRAEHNQKKDEKINLKTPRIILFLLKFNPALQRQELYLGHQPTSCQRHDSPNPHGGFLLSSRIPIHLTNREQPLQHPQLMCFFLKENYIDSTLRYNGNHQYLKKQEF